MTCRRGPVTLASEGRLRGARRRSHWTFTSPRSVEVDRGASRVTDTHASTTQGQAAIVAALAAHTAESDGHAPWLAAADLARRTGTTGAHDPQFEADVQALFDAGTIRLMSGGDAGGGR